MIKVKFNKKPNGENEKKKEKIKIKKKIPPKNNKKIEEKKEKVDKTPKKTDKKADNSHKDKIDKIDKIIQEKTSLKKDENPKKEEKIEEKEKIKIDPNKKIVSEKTGFGYKGLGSRKILFDDDTKQYLYCVYEPVLDLKDKLIKNKLIHYFRIRAEVDIFEFDMFQKHKQLENSLNDLIKENNIIVSPQSKDKIFYYIFQEFLGYGKIDIMMNDDEIEDISCDGQDIPIFIYHKTYENIKSNVKYTDKEELDSFVIKLSQLCGKQISVYEPVVDGKLEDGSRLQTTLGKTITKYSTFTIRRFRKDPLTPVDLIENNTMSIEMAAYFWLAIEKGASILFCGGTASGKTTMLNALSLFLPNTFKIVSVEDTREINLPHENWIAGTTRTGFTTTDKNKSGKDIDMFDLIRVALRQRPRAIIVGEVRGKETYSLFQAMTTGHLSYSTVHASDMHSLIQRLESPPINLPRALLTALDIIVFLNNLTIKGKPVRRITNVTEIIKLDPETNRLVTISPFYWISELNDTFRDTKGSKILKKIRLENMWDEDSLNKELNNRIKVLEMMMKNKKRSYLEVGKIITEYNNNPKKVLKMVEDSK